MCLRRRRAFRGETHANRGGTRDGPEDTGHNRSMQNTPIALGRVRASIRGGPEDWRAGACSMRDKMQGFPVQLRKP